MNLEQFNILPIKDQVDYINIQLETTSLNKACLSLGVSESTVRDRFKRHNYKREGKKFVFTETTNTITNTNVTVEPIERKLKPVKKPNKDTNTLDSVKLLEEKIKTLESQIEATNKRIDNITTTKTTVNTTTNTTFTTYDRDKDIIRSFRINEEVQKRFTKYCKVNSDRDKGITVSDILSTILDEYLSKKNY